MAEAESVVATALRVFEQHEDELGQCRAWCLRAMNAWLQGQVASADKAWQRGAKHARNAGDERELFEILAWRVSAAPIGPTPVPEAIRRCAEICEQVQSSPLAVAQMLPPFAAVHAMEGDFDTARSLVRKADGILGELGRMYTVGLAHFEASVELLAGKPEVAEERLRRAYDRLHGMGEKVLLATTAAMLAEALYEQDRLEEAQEFCCASQDSAVDEDLTAQAEWRGVQSKILARSRRHEEAEALAGEAVELVVQTDLLGHRGNALLDLGEVLRLAGQPAASHGAIRAGLELYERKGDRVSAARARSKLEAGGSK